MIYTLFHNKVQLHISAEHVIKPYCTWKITQGKTKYTLRTVFFIYFSKIIFKKHDIYFKVLNVYYVSATYNLKDGINISLRHFYSFFSMGWQHCVIRIPRLFLAKLLSDSGCIEKFFPRYEFSYAFDYSLYLKKLSDKWCIYMASP